MFATVQTTLEMIVPSIRRAVSSNTPSIYNGAKRLFNTTAVAPNMFCFQCEQTKNGTGCTDTEAGICGKSADVATLQDLLVHNLKGLAQYTNRARAAGVPDAALDPAEKFMFLGMFSTLTNVNFDGEAVRGYIDQSVHFREQVKQKFLEKAGKSAGAVKGPAEWVPPQSGLTEDYVREGLKYSIPSREAALGREVMALQELITYGLKGMCAYGEHALVLGQWDSQCGAFVSECLDMMVSDKGQDPNTLLDYVHKTGLTNFRVMELLDGGHRQRFGTPEPSKTRITPVEGKCILVSGHDIADLEGILQACEGKGINVYTHGELLPANSYPEIKKYKCLKGNYGGPWQLQKMEFAQFPGAVVLTTNCLMPPRDSYKGRLFTTGAVGHEGVRHIENKDWTPVIEAALEAEGFNEKNMKRFGPEKFITIGFSHDAILNPAVANQVVDAIKGGKISRFFVIGGCDGTETERSYFTDLSKSVPEDGVILTMGCGKYRFNKMDFGTVPGTEIPRLLDMGQCNDAFGAIKVATTLAEVFECGVNDLPLSLALSWFEQKAVAVLLTLLSLGVKNVRIGPKAPAFLTPNAIKLLHDQYNLDLVGDVKSDLEKMYGRV